MIAHRRHKERRNVVAWLFSAVFSGLLVPSVSADFETEIAAEGGKWAN